MSVNQEKEIKIGLSGFLRQIARQMAHEFRGYNSEFFSMKNFAVKGVKFALDSLKIYIRAKSRLDPLFFRAMNTIPEAD
jgi:hypothetical protein